ncbi:phosphoribosyltransferase [Arenimonas caeni]|jgi:putative phosphoribosyl transferase|uniref:phosphoribosyltransferase n=1 Tax=Arenimonas caeni TaxID=2058085 RepID=UPI002A369854|nr:phosphoribosyltransferase family protein [Arenimonas caeni]MDY0021019.1 phosphoribosyltransferase family protein [Arenimonas caeni]
MEHRFRDRRDAGQALARALAGWRGVPGLQVLALPRGGVPVAAEVATALDAPLDVLVVRKVGWPAQPEVALAAIASGGAMVTNPHVLAVAGVEPDELEALAAAERREFERRERAYRGGRPPLDVAGRPVLVVDDGLATGATMLAALSALRALDVGKLGVAVPVGSPESVRRCRELADEVTCLLTPRDFGAVGAYYDLFPQVADEEVRHLLSR